jgi:transporter family protein
MLWLVMAILSALFAGLTAVLTKCGIRRTDSDIATALRTIVVLLFAWIMVLIVGSAHTIGQISAKSLIYLMLSGLATGASWICYCKALSVGDINKVVPVDKSSTVLSVLLAIILFQETKNLPIKLIATAMLAVGVFLMIEKKERNSFLKHILQLTRQLLQSLHRLKDIELCGIRLHFWMSLNSILL